MNSRILVSIVTYNSAEVIAECVGALSWLRDAPALKAQIVVADNASGDNTVEVLSRMLEGRSDDLVTIVRSATNVGWGAGNNLAIGARRFDPDYVLLCNPDAHIDEANFRALLDALKQNEPRAAIAVPFLEGSGATVLGANPEWGAIKYLVSGYTSGRRKYQRFQARYSRRRGSFEIPKAYASGALALVSFPALRDAGFFDERIFMFNDDIDMTRRILQRGHTLVGTGEAHGHHLGGRGARIGEEAGTGTSVASLHFASELIFVEKWYGRTWARLVAAYRWYFFFRANNLLRRVVRREPLAYEPLRAPAGQYLKQSRSKGGPA